MRPINKGRLARAVQEINRKKKIPARNALQFSIAHAILLRKNELYDAGYAWHSALQHAAAEQPDLGTVRAAFYRKVIALYDRWTYAAMKARGYEPPDVPASTRKVGDGEALELSKKRAES